MAQRFPEDDQQASTPVALLGPRETAGGEARAGRAARRERAQETTV
jgi:hypothetical protein